MRRALRERPACGFRVAERPEILLQRQVGLTRGLELAGDLLADAAAQLTDREPRILEPRAGKADILEVARRKVGARQARLRQIGIFQIGMPQRRAPEVGPAHLGVAKVGILHPRILEVRTRQGRGLERGFLQQRALENGVGGVDLRKSAAP